MIYKRGAQGIYWYRFRFGGKIIHESVRSTSKTVARAAERSRRRELEQTWNKIEKRTLPPTFSQAAKEWLAERESSIAPGTKETYEAAKKHLTDCFGATLVCDIASDDVRGYQQKRLKERAAAATVNKELICLGSILRHCGVWHTIQKGVKLLREPESAGRALETEEEKGLLAAASQVGRAQGHWSPIYPVTAVGLNTGMRHSEIRQLRWEQVNLETRVLIVGQSKTKAGSGRCVPLNQPAWAALDMWASRFPNRKPDQYVFPACENGRIDPTKPVSHWRTAWQHACERARLWPLGFHSLRHSAATKLLENGVPFAVVAQILGWSASTAVRMAKRYGHIRPDVQRSALERIATPEIQTGVHQIDNQVGGVLKSEVAN